MDERLEWLRDYGVDPDKLDDKTASYAHCFHCDGTSFNRKGEPCEHCKGSGLYRDDCLRCGVRLDDHFDSDHYFAPAQDNGFSEDDFHVRNLAAKTRLVMPAVCPSCQSTETRGRYHRGGWREYTCLDCGSEFKNRDSRIAMPLYPSQLQKHIEQNGPYAYHTTSPDNIDNILRDGLKPGVEPQWDEHLQPRPGHVYMWTKDLQDCYMCGGKGKLGTAPHEVEHSCDVCEGSGKSPRTLRIDMRKLDPAKFASDEDEVVSREDADKIKQQWSDTSESLGDHVDKNKAIYDHPDMVERSLQGGSFAYHGHIPPDAIDVNPKWIQQAAWLDENNSEFKNRDSKIGHLGDDLGFHDQRDQWEQHLDTERAPDTSKIRDCASCGEPWGFVLSPSLGVYVRRHLDERESDHPLSKGHRPIEEHEIIRGIEAHVSDDKAMHHANPEQLRTDHPYWDQCGTCGGDGIQVGSTDVLTGEQKQSPCKDCGGIGEAYDAEYWDSDDQLHDFANYPNFHQMNIPDKSLKTHLKDVHQTDKGYDDAYVQHQMTHGINIDPAIAEILMPKAASQKQGMAADADYWNVTKPKELWHQTQGSNIPGILKNGLVPQGGESEFNNEFEDDRLQTRPGHVYFHTKPKSFSEPHMATVVVDSAGVNPHKLKADEDWAEHVYQHGTDNGWLDHDPPPSEESWDDDRGEPEGLGAWADRVNLGDDIGHTHDSIEWGTVAHEGPVAAKHIKGYYLDHNDEGGDQHWHPNPAYKGEPHKPDTPAWCTKQHAWDNTAVRIAEFTPGDTTYPFAETQTPDFRPQPRGLDPWKDRGDNGVPLHNDMVFDPKLKKWINPEMSAMPAEVNYPGNGLMSQSSTENETSWHLTDNPKFALNPDYNPENNTTLGGDYPHKGIFLGSPEHWLNRYDYVRPFVAEISHPPVEGVGGYGGEKFLPADQFDKATVKRVIPLDEYCHEEFHAPGWIEESHGEHPNIPSDYRYTGPDVRDMSKGEVNHHLRRTNEYINSDRPHLLICKDCPYPEKDHNRGPDGWAWKDFGKHPFKSPGPLYQMTTKKGQTWTQSVDAPPNGGNVKRLPYDPYPEGKGETHTLDVLPAPTGEDVKKWKTVKTFPGDKSFADHPQSQDRIDNMPQVVGEKLAVVQVVAMALVNDDELPPKLRDTIEAFKTLPNVHRLQDPVQAAMRCGPASYDFAEFAKSRGHNADIRLLRDDTFQNVWKNNTQREHDEYQGSRHAVPYVDGHYVDWTARQYTPDSPVPRVYKNLKAGDAVGSEGVPFAKYFKAKDNREDGYYGLMKFQEGAEEWDPSYRNPRQVECRKHKNEWSDTCAKFPEGHINISECSCFTKPNGDDDVDKDNMYNYNPPFNSKPTCPIHGGQDAVKAWFAQHPPKQAGFGWIGEFESQTTPAPRTKMDRLKKWVDENLRDPNPCETCGEHHPLVAMKIDPDEDYASDADDYSKFFPEAHLHTWAGSDGPKVIHNEGKPPSLPFNVTVNWNPYAHQRDHATMGALHEVGHVMQALHDWDNFKSKSRYAYEAKGNVHSDPDFEREAFTNGVEIARQAGIKITPDMRDSWRMSVGGEHLAHAGDDLGFHDESESWEDRAQDRGMWGSNPVQNNTEEGVCRHCHRRIINDEKDGWVDPEATGDDGIWRDMCDAHDTFEATHEPEGPHYDEDDDPNGMKTAGFEWMDEFKVAGEDWSPEIYCPKCGSDRTEATGDHETIGDDEIPEIVREERECHDCGRYFQWNMEGHHEGKPYLKGPGGSRIEGKTALFDYDPVRDVQPSSNSAPAPDATKPAGDPWPNQVHDGVNPDRPGYIFDKKLKKFIRDEQLTYPDVGPTFPGVTDINKVGHDNDATHMLCWRCHGHPESSDWRKVRYEGGTPVCVTCDGTGLLPNTHWNHAVGHLKDEDYNQEVRASNGKRHKIIELETPGAKMRVGWGDDGWFATADPGHANRYAPVGYHAARDSGYPHLGWCDEHKITGGHSENFDPHDLVSFVQKVREQYNPSGQKDAALDADHPSYEVCQDCYGKDPHCQTCGGSGLLHHELIEDPARPGEMRCADPDCDGRWFKAGQAHPQPVGMHEGDNGIDDPMKHGDPSQVKKIIPGTQRTVPETNVWNVSIDNLNKTGASNWPGLGELKRPWAEDRGYKAYDPWLMGGGCAHLALAMKAAWPEGKIAAAWYDDHGRRALSHAAFYDPKSGHAWDGTGAHKSADIAVSTHPGSDIEMDADPHKVAEHMGIDFSDEAPFADDGIADAWNTVDEHFMPASARTCRECGELGVHDTERGLCKDCATKREAAVQASSSEATSWDVVNGGGAVVADGIDHDFGGADEANDWRISNEPDDEWKVIERFAQAQQAADVDGEREPEEPKLTDRQLHVMKNHPMMAEEIASVEDLTAFADPELQQLHLQDHALNQHDHNPEVLRVAKRSS